jgi:hypothetical protein
MHRHSEYIERLGQAYEGEVAGAAYFRRLAGGFPEKREFFLRCCHLEQQTAAALHELVTRYRCPARPAPELAAQGEREAQLEIARGLPALFRTSIEEYPRYLAGFLELEALAPAQDRPMVAALAEHEAQLIAWMRAEQA